MDIVLILKGGYFEISCCMFLFPTIFLDLNHCHCHHQLQASKHATPSQLIGLWMLLLAIAVLLSLIKNFFKSTSIYTIFLQFLAMNTLIATFSKNMGSILATGRFISVSLSRWFALPKSLQVCIFQMNVIRSSLFVITLSILSWMSCSFILFYMKKTQRGNLSLPLFVSSRCIRVRILTLSIHMFRRF